MTRLRRMRAEVRRMLFVTGPSLSSLICNSYWVIVSLCLTFFLDVRAPLFDSFEKREPTHRGCLGRGELLRVPLDGVEGGVGRVARVGRRRGRQRHLRATRVGQLRAPHGHQLHQLRKRREHFILRGKNYFRPYSQMDFLRLRIFSLGGLPEYRRGRRT